MEACTPPSLERNDRRENVDTSSTHHSLIDLGPSSPNGGITIKREPIEHKPLLHNILSTQPHLGPGHVSLLTAHRTNAYTTNTNGKKPICLVRYSCVCVFLYT
ncbi:hypothetical protein RUM43_010609 [Polyplax serrata]|uniref:Uncharacterized protein n=1 Tax=Polyplax serrata TaxID=468196 RepID=A0AAN8PLL8_POLSC